MNEEEILMNKKEKLKIYLYFLSNYNANNALYYLTKEDIINYFREHGKYDLLLLNLIGLYYPEYSCFNNKFLLDVLSGNKKVIKIIIYNILFSLLATSIRCDWGISSSVLYKGKVIYERNDISNFSR